MQKKPVNRAGRAQFRAKIRGNSQLGGENGNNSENKRKLSGAVDNEQTRWPHEILWGRDDDNKKRDVRLYCGVYTVYRIFTALFIIEDLNTLMILFLWALIENWE